MQISNFLALEAVRFVGQLSSKKRLFQELAEIAGATYNLSPLRVSDGLQERESLGPTGVGHGIALPHARLDDLQQIVAVFIRLDKPLNYESVDRQPVDLIFSLLAPKNSGAEHLKALALISRTMRDPALVSKLRANSEASTLHAILTTTKNPALAG